MLSSSRCLRHLPLAAAALLAASPAAALTIDFEGGANTHGTVVAAPSGVVSGVTFTVSNPTGPDLGVLFDTERSPFVESNDDDLLRLNNGWNGGNLDTGNVATDPVFGLALTIQENSTGCADNVCNDPDDEADGGTILIDLTTSFADGVYGFGLDVIDIDSNEGDAGGLTFFDDDTSYFYSWEDLVGAGNLGDNSANRVASIDITDANLALLGFDGIDKVLVTFENSGAIDNVEIDEEFPPVPEPGTSLLLGLGLAGLAVAGRPRR